MGFDVKQGNVAYINLELQRYPYAERKAAIAREMGIKKFPEKAMQTLHLRGMAASVETLQKFFKEREQEFSLIVVDPLYKILGRRSENDASDMGDLLLRLENIAKMSGASLAVAHHFAKGNAASKEIIDRHSGSGVVARDGDTIITLTPHEEEDCFTMDFTLRDFAPVDPRVVRWQYPFFRVDTTLDPEALKQPKSKQKTTVSVEDLETSIPDLLAEAASPKGADEIVLKLGSEKRVRTLLKVLTERGQIDSIVQRKCARGPGSNLYKAKPENESV